MRIATFNAALSREHAGQLVQDLRLGGTPQTRAVAEIIQRVRPDILLVNEIDHDPRGLSTTLFAAHLRTGRRGATGIDYPHLFTAPVNTGVLAPVDLDGDGRLALPGDGFGYGRHPGHYGMAVFSRFPIADVRTFQHVLWRSMPDHLMPPGFFSPEAEAVLRLSSKSHWDVAVEIDGVALHLLASHPTPPVFDGPEDRNGRRNADELRFWIDYIDGRGWMTDDAGRTGAFGGGAFVILGDLNADPEGGERRMEGIGALLGHPLVQDPRPMSTGAADAPNRDTAHRGDPALATASWRLGPGPGTLRVDYVLPSADLTVADAGVFWPAEGERHRRLVGDGARIASSDHRLVWVDIAWPPAP